MKFYTLFLCLLPLLSFSQIDELRKAQEQRKKIISTISSSEYFSKSLFVDPFIGTGGHGHTYPGASAPFGMIQLSPDTRYQGWDGCSGYHYSDSIIYGFSHTHLSGTGVPDYCDLLILPQSGKPNVLPGYLSEKGYGSQFSHQNEYASPGFYSVHLDRGDIDVRLSVSERAGIHEYTFNEKKGKKFILIDLDHRDDLLASCMEIVDKKTVKGCRISKGWAEEQHFYFFLKLDTPFQKARRIKSNGNHKLLLTFPKNTTKINLTVGISAVDIPGAQGNLEREIPHFDLNKVRAESVRKWNKELDKIEFIQDDEKIMTTFYTALYHSYLAPNLFNDIDGRYRNLANKVDTLAGKHKNYTVFSLWDTYRATHPLFTITQVERTNEFIKTFLRHFEDTGDLPVWELAGNETNCMIGYHSVSIIADAFTKGIRDYNSLGAIRSMLGTTSIPEFGKNHYTNFGFISTGDEPESVSKTLEYSYDDFCIYRMIEEMGNIDHVLSNKAVGEEFLNRSFNFLNVYDPQSKFMRARRSGLWFSPFAPEEVNFNYTEANSWQYSLYAPHAIHSLAEILGGKDSLETWLDRLYTTPSKLSGRHQVDITGLIGQYAHGNEPSHHMAYLYNYTNAPHKTQNYVNRIFTEMYTDQPDGLAGNEDCGQMSSWYVLSALGFYQIAPGNPYYDIGRPLMNTAKINLENGKTFELRVKNQSEENKYIQSLKLNGENYNLLYLSHDDISNGGNLVYTMGPNPNDDLKNWKKAPGLDKVPYSFVPVPYFKNEDRVFDQKTSIELDCLFAEDVTIHYTTDKSIPNISSKVYEEPIEITESTVISAIAYKDSVTSSSVISNEFVKKDPNIKIELMSEYDNQYAAYGDLTLIDGIRGVNEFRTGDWQGYWAQDLIAEVSFDAARDLAEVGISVLSDIKSWIFFPSEVKAIVEFENGSVKHYHESLPEASLKMMGAQTKEIDFHLGADTPKVVKVKIVAINYGKCPEWHLGRGNDTWLFADEIILR